MKKINKWVSKLLHGNAGKIGAVALLCSVAPNAVASNVGNVPAAIKVWIIGTVIALIISLIFNLKKNENGTLEGLKVGMFFLLFSILLIIVFVAGVAGIFIFM